MKQLLAMLLLTVSQCSPAADLIQLPRQSAQDQYARRAALPEPARCIPEETVQLDVALTEGAMLETHWDSARGRLQIFYRMSFNDVTEGWNWHPENALAGDDYYVFKFLPLGSTEETRQTYLIEGINGQTETFKVQWRYDYYFAFDNPYDFYARNINADTGFVTELAVSEADAKRLLRGDLHMALRGQLAKGCLAESTTYWRGISANPVDFTMKKRYLIGKLREVIFYDAEGDKILASISPQMRYAQ